MNNPYAQLGNHQFWRRSISGQEAHLVDPVIKTKFKIAQGDRVATAGSCFAQHISRRLKQIGFNYYVVENGDGLDETERGQRNFGVFSARYGNIYTTVQLKQLFDEAFGERVPHERCWFKSNGRAIDPYRQQIEPNGFNSEQEVYSERETHLAAVRELFQTADVFVFTLGLTEAWRSKVDGSVFPIAPGVNGGSFDPEAHEFINLDVSETVTPLLDFLQRLKEVNKEVRVLLTVSPVPLIATYEDRSVLVSTVYSKSVLRVAAEMASKQFGWVDYFPSYEIITGNFNGGRYYAEDFRDASPVGVAHVMRCFTDNYVAGSSRGGQAARFAEIASSVNHNVVCDEEALERLRS